MRHLTMEEYLQEMGYNKTEIEEIFEELEEEL